jgi:Protein of unknown function (DUF4011)
MEEIGRFADDAVLANEVAGSDIPASRWKLLDAAIRVWKNQLVDLTARNSLLYYRDLRVGTLDFTGRELYVDQVLGGSPVRLSSVFAANVPRVSFAKRARAIRGKAKEAFEERGLDTMFLAHGMATWDEDVERRSRPQAPVVLVPMGLEVHGAGAQDFELQITGEPRINPTLLRKLESEFGVPIAAEEFDQQLIDAASTVELAATFSRLSDLAHTVSGFDITPKTVLGTFSYDKLPMVLDLDRARDELAQHELIAALCGDEEARGQLRSRALPTERTGARRSRRRLRRPPRWWRSAHATCHPLGSR